MKQITVAIAGLGSRGMDAYARYADAAPEEMKIVAVADILPDRVERAAKKYNVPAERCFASAEEMFEQEKLADAAFICTMDRMQRAGRAGGKAGAQGDRGSRSALYALLSPPEEHSG